MTPSPGVDVAGAVHRRADGNRAGIETDIVHEVGFTVAPRARCWR